MSTQYTGIDYGMGQSNRDKETGIHYGVISMNSINLDCTDGFEYQYAGPNCPKCGNAVIESDGVSLFENYEASDGEEIDADGAPEWFDGKDYCCLRCKECHWSDSVWSEESTGWTYSANGYELTGCLDNDIFVLKSPYYTHAQYCSPCVPGAGNLDNPVDDGPMTYCLGPEWFDEHSPMPYVPVSI